MNQDVSAKELRRFGLLVGGILNVIGLWPMLLYGESLRWWAVGLGGLLLAIGGVLPLALAPLHKGWMWVGELLGWINTRILLSIVFYGMITPISIAFRLMGKDMKRQSIFETRPTYRVIRQPRPRSHMKYQF